MDNEIEAQFPNVVTTLQSDEQAILAGAIEYLSNAALAAQGRTVVAVGAVLEDAEVLAFKVAAEHGFDSFLALFKSSIDDGIANVTAAAATEVNTLISKGIASLSALKNA